MIRAIIFDIGGVLERSVDGREPAVGFESVVAAWERRLGLASGALARELGELQERGVLGTCSLEQWEAELRERSGMTPEQLQRFMGDFWDVYLGQPNVELAGFLSRQRPRYRTALLSNSFVGAREQEQERYAFAELVDLIVYSHEEGVAKPEGRIYELTCARLGVRPEEAVFLDDVEAYVAGARAAGLHAVHFESNPQAIAAIEALLIGG